MSRSDIERLGVVLENWTQGAPSPSDVDGVTLDAQKALIEAGMVQFNPRGWDFKLHEKHPEAPRAQFKLMIREADGVNLAQHIMTGLSFLRYCVLKKAVA